MTTSKASRALMKRIEQVANSQFRSETDYLATSQFASPLFEHHFELLSEMGSDRLVEPEDVRALLDISKAVDCIQNGTADIVTPTDESGFFSDQYLNILKNVEFSEADVSAELQALYDQAMTKLFVDAPFIKTESYATFTSLRSDTELKDVSILELRKRLAAEVDVDEKTKLNLELSELVAFVTEQKQLLNALNAEHQFLEAENIRSRLEQSVVDLPDSVKRGVASIDSLLIADAASGDSHILADFQPAQLAEDNWTTININKAEINAQTTNDGALTTSAEISDLGELNNQRIESIELEVQILSVQRPWFWDELFSNKQWGWRAPSKQISDGKSEPKGLIPAYVKALVVARNLKIKGQSSGFDDTIKKIKLGNIVTHLQFSRTKAIRANRISGKLVKTKFVAPQLSINPTINSNVFNRLGTTISSPAVRSIGTVVRDTRVSVESTNTTGNSVSSMLSLSRALNFNTRFMSAILLTGNIKGVITDQSGRALKGVKLALHSSEGKLVKATSSGANGRYSISFVGTGTYTLFAKKPGFVKKNVIVSSPVRQAVDFVMTQLAQSDIEMVLLLKEGSVSQDKPYLGQATIIVKGINSDFEHREEIDESPEIKINLPVGRYRVSVSSNDATAIEPKTLDVNQTASSPPLIVRLTSNLLLRNSSMYLIGFVCRKVPASPSITIT